MAEKTQIKKPNDGWESAPAPAQADGWESAPAPTANDGWESASAPAAPVADTYSGPQFSAPTGTPAVDTRPSEAAAVEPAYQRREFQRLSPEEQIRTKLSSDFKSSITAQVVNSIGQISGVDALKLPHRTLAERYADLGMVGNLATAPLAFAADPLGSGLFEKAAKLAPKIPGLGKVFNSADDLYRAREAARYEMQTYGDVVESAYKSASYQYMKNRLLRGAAEGAAQFGAFEGSREALISANEGDFDVARIAQRTLEGAGMGAVIGPVMGMLKGEDPSRVSRILPDVQADGAMARDLKRAAEPSSVGSIAGRIEQVNQRLEKVTAELYDIERGAKLTTQVDPAAAQARFEALRAEAESLAVAKREAISNYQNFVLATEKVEGKPRIGGGLSKPEYLQLSADFADREAKRLVDRGVIKPEQAPTFSSATFEDLIRQKGFKPEPGSKTVMGGSRLTLTTEKLNLADRAYGTDAVGTYLDGLQANARYHHGRVSEGASGHQAVTALQQRGFTNEQITKVMQHLEDLPQGGYALNPAELSSKAHTRTALPPELANAVAENPEFLALKGELDRVYSLATENGRREVGRVSTGYVPILPKKGTYVPVSGQQSVAQIESPSIYRERMGGVLDPMIHETDPHRWFQSYVDRVLKDREFTPLLQRAGREIQVLSHFDRQAANELTRTVGEFLGFNSEQAVAYKLGEQLASFAEPEIRRVMAQVGLEDDMYPEIVRAMQQLQFDALVLKPKTILAQGLQPDFVGGAEIGFKNVQRGRAELLKNKEFRNFVSGFDVYLKNVELEELEALRITQPIQGRVLKPLTKALEMPTRLLGLRNAFGALEATNRRTVFAGAYLQFKDAAVGGERAMNAALDGLLEGQRNVVVRAYKQGGVEAAAQSYALIRNMRTNFVFDMVEKPELLKKGLGAYIPFTTWGTNQIARFVTDAGRIGQGSAKQLARRVALPFIYINAFAALTGHYPEGINPVNDITSLPGAAFPVAQDAMKAVQTGVYKPFFQRYTPGVNQMQTYERLRKQGASPVAAGLGLAKDNRTTAEKWTPTWLHRALTDPKRK